MTEGMRGWDEAEPNTVAPVQVGSVAVRGNLERQHAQADSLPDGRVVAGTEPKQQTSDTVRDIWDDSWMTPKRA